MTSEMSASTKPRSKPLCRIYLALLCCLAATLLQAQDQGRPNVLYILADDLGYGDVQALNPERGKIKTPHWDKMIADGMYFTDAHSGSSVCTPTRYGVLTGRYCWRTHLQDGVLYGYGAPLIAPERMTVASLMKKAGYATACIGKWHLGMNLPKEGEDWQKPIGQSPVANGFDYYYGISASLDMPPYVFIENDKLTKPLTTQKAFFRRGPAAQDFEAEDVLPILTRKTCEYLASRKGKNEPFFIYMPLTSPHTPVVPTKEWKGKSEIAGYGDFVMQTDAAVGEVLAALEASGHAHNTIVIMTSDNGCSPTKSHGKNGHFPSERARGYKSDLWDGGHRVPFIVRWPAKIKPGGKSDQTICLTDLMATCAELVNVALPPNAGEDSVSFLPALLGTDKGPLREATIHHAIYGHFAIRQGPWKLLLCSGSGGWSKAADSKSMQLYNMNEDPGEQKNVYAEHPEIVKKLTELLQSYVANGRSTPGEKQKNDAEIEIIKSKNKAAKKGTDDKEDTDDKSP